MRCRRCLQHRKGGADYICLCETNGGAFPDEVSRIVEQVLPQLRVPVGIHTHDDGGMAVASSVMAVLAGAQMVQGTLIGLENAAAMQIFRQSSRICS